MLLVKLIAVAINKSKISGLFLADFCIFAPRNYLDNKNLCDGPIAQLDRATDF
jgi:hypothetical protein